MKSPRHRKKWVKAHFNIRPRRFGTAEIRSEALWAFAKNGREFVVDNIPFFAKTVHRGDLVSGLISDGHLLKPRVVKSSRHRTLRLIVIRRTRMGALRRKLHKLGCLTERSQIPGFLAVDVPPGVKMTEIHKWLKAPENNRDWLVE